VPLAICRPRLSAEWLVPLVLWVCPSLHVAEWQALVAATVTAATIYLLMRDRPLQQGRPGQPDVLATAQGGERAG
jgi:hypothetical protein